MAQKDVDPGSLYELPLDEFIGARDALARQLKESGDAEGAREVKALRKPSVAAWAVNQLARSGRENVSDLMDAGKWVGAAQQKAFSGSGRQELQRATAERSRLLDRLVARAGEILESAGHAATRATLDLVTDTLRATATDEETATLVREGRLAREVRAPAGFEEFLSLAPSQVQEATPSQKTSPADQKARRRAYELSRTADEAEEVAARLHKEASEAEEASRKAQQAARRAAAAADRADERAAQARRKADEAALKAGGRSST